MPLRTSEDLEKLYVLFEEQSNKNMLYQEFASDWALKRKLPWKDFEEVFLMEIQLKDGILLDAGSGSGRNLPIFLSQSSVVICTDIAIQQLLQLKRSIEKETSITNKDKKKGFVFNMKERTHLVTSDISNSPFRDGIIDTIASVSTIHHLKTKENRIESINVLLRCLNNEGNLFFTVWRFDTERFSDYYLWQTNIFKSFNSGSIGVLPKIGSNQIEFGDVIVPWTYVEKNKTYYRFYHLFTKESLEDELINFQNTKIELFGKEKKENFYVIIPKKDNTTKN